MKKIIKSMMSILPDSVYLKLLFKYHTGYRLDLKNPKTFNEKLQWLKLYNKKEEYTMLVDKVMVKEYVAKLIGEQYIIPTLGIWKDENEIDFSTLPDQFVLKCNHNSGLGMYICKDKNLMDEQKVRENLKKGLKQDYYKCYREWPYKNVKHLAFAEKFMVDESGCELKDYKVLCFNGEPKLIELHQGRFTKHQSQDFYDTNWKMTNITQNCTGLFGSSGIRVERPENLDLMLELSGILAKDIPHVRVDWYSIKGQLYFGEMTFFDGSGLEKFDKYEDDLLLGSWIDLNRVF